MKTTLRMLLRTDSLAHVFAGRCPRAGSPASANKAAL